MSGEYYLCTNNQRIYNKFSVIAPLYIIGVAIISIGVAFYLSQVQGNYLDSINYELFIPTIFIVLYGLYLLLMPIYIDINESEIIIKTLLIFNKRIKNDDIKLVIIKYSRSIYSITIVRHKGSIYNILPIIMDFGSHPGAYLKIATPLKDILGVEVSIKLPKDLIS